MPSTHVHGCDWVNSFPAQIVDGSTLLNMSELGNFALLNRHNFGVLFSVIAQQGTLDLVLDQLQNMSISELRVEKNIEHNQMIIK